MKIVLSLLISSILLIAIATLVLSQLCQIREGSCPTGETCILSMWNLTNSHAAECGYYTNYSLCCGVVGSALINSTAQAICASPYNAILSINNTTDAHVARIDYYTYEVCTNWLNCTLEYDSCTSPRIAIASLNSTENSHIAEPTYYGYKLCCGECDTSDSFCEECFYDNVLAGKCDGLPCWNLGGELPGAATCCGDDVNEIKRTRVCEVGVCFSDPNDDACCDSSDKCVYNSICYENAFVGDVNGDGIDESCDAGIWIVKPPTWKILWRDLIRSIARILGWR